MATVSDTNLLTRRKGAALLNLQETPMLAYPVTGYVLIDSDPQKANGHVEMGNTRDHFPEWPDDSVVKVRPGGTPLKNLLRFRCRSRQRSYDIDGKYDTTTWASALSVLVGLVGVGTVNDSAIWSGGDNKPYSDATLVENLYQGQVEDPPGSGNFRDSWRITEYVHEYDDSGGVGTFVVISSSVIADSPTQNTTGNPFLGNNTTFGGQDFSDLYFYSTYSGSVLDYGELIENHSNDDVSYSDKDVYFSCRSDDQDEHGLELHLELDVAMGSRIQYKTPTTRTYLANSYTFKHADSDLIYGPATRVETQGRWVYEPDATTCGTCWYKDKEIEVEVTFKKAQVTHTNNDSGGGTASLGSWSAHSTQSFTLTLPDSTAATELGSTFTFPEEDGYVVAISDIRLVSIT